MIFITGDTYGGFQRFTTKSFPQQRQMSRNDYVIITGDFGGVWDNSPKETYWLDWLEEKPFTSSAQAPHPSPRRKRQGSLTPLSLLFPRNLLRWACAGPRLWTGTTKTSTGSVSFPSTSGRAEKSAISAPYTPPDAGAGFQD